VPLPSVVSAPLAHVAAHLRCPTCAGRLASASRTLRCARGHSFDVARQGYVALLPPRRRPITGDDAAMVAARAAVLDAQHFAPLTAALVRSAVAVRDAPLVLDVGAGTGHHLAAVLDALPDAHGVAFDASRPALRRAVRAHPRIAAVAGDVWQAVPVRDASVDLALNVFAPRNPSELARVLRPGATLAVVTPAPGHLREVASLHRVGIAPGKRERLHRDLHPWFDLVCVRRVAWTLRLTRAEARAVVRMGPAGHHRTPGVVLPETLTVTAAVDLHIFLRSPARVVPFRGVRSWWGENMREGGRREVLAPDLPGRLKESV
jgi:23S rRNA (guanine745-N1)-methyltransferase